MIRPEARAERAAGPPGRSCAARATGRRRRGPAPARSATRPAPRPVPPSRRRSARCVRRRVRSAARGRRQRRGRPARRQAPLPRDRRSPRPGRSRRGVRRRHPGRGSPPGRSWPRVGPRRGRRDGRSGAHRPRRVPGARAGSRRFPSRRAAVAAPTGPGGDGRPASGRRHSPSSVRRCPTRPRPASWSSRPVAASVARGARPRPRRPLRRCRSRPPHPRDGGACRAAKSVATLSAIRRSRPRRPRSGVSGTGQASVFGGRIRRQPVRVRRIPSASGGPSTSPAAAIRVVSAGRNSNML